MIRDSLLINRIVLVISLTALSSSRHILVRGIERRGSGGQGEGDLHRLGLQLPTLPSIVEAEKERIVVGV